MGLSYTWCNSYKLTHFLYHRFLRDLTVQKTIKCYYFPPYYLINIAFSLSLSLSLLLSLSLFIAFHHIKFSSTQSNKKILKNNLIFIDFTKLPITRVK